jgi:hypothetical protein
MINFKSLQSVYNQQINLLLAEDGLTTPCILNYGVSKKLICPNCIFDPNLKKSANRYKTGGPISFSDNNICPYCNGIGYYGETKNETINLAVIWEYNKFMNFPKGVDLPDGLIQTISSIELLPDIRKCQSMSVQYPSAQNKLHEFKLHGEPKPAGLGNNAYIITTWQKIN